MPKNTVVFHLLHVHMFACHHVAHLEWAPAREGPAEFACFAYHEPNASRD